MITPEQSRQIENYLPVNTRLSPTFYAEFHCIADRCKNNCCHDWGIRFSKKDYLTIKRAPKSPELEELTRKAMRRLPDGTRTTNVYGEFVATTGACPYQQEDGLCALQKGCGAEILPTVCRQFPRMHKLTPMGQLHTLTTACEAVVELLLEHPEGIDFVEDPLTKQEQRVIPRTGGNMLWPVLFSTTIDILQARQFSIAHRMILLGMVLDEVCRTGFEQLDREQWVQKVYSLLQQPELTDSLDKVDRNTQLYVANQLRTLWTLVKQKDEGHYFAKVMEQIHCPWNQEGNFHFKLEYYQELEQAFDQKLGDLSYFWENLLVNTCCHLCIPHVKSEQELWKSYVNLCNLYGLFRFVAIVCGGTEPSREKLVESIVRVSRSMLHNSQRMTDLQDQFFTNDSATLAHMAILVKA